MEADEGGNPFKSHQTLDHGKGFLWIDLPFLCDKQQIKSFTALQFYVVIAAALAGFFDVFIAFGVVLLSGKYLRFSWLV